ncbi:hypothetical protein ACOZ4N_17175 [Halorientalis pallida]|uniref:hypothetical protein n=1 Tax=Halorientalis pallida TaxID=2479928 RepID=UPI003C6FD6ED
MPKPLGTEDATGGSVLERVSGDEWSREQDGATVRSAVELASGPEAREPADATGARTTEGSPRTVER